MKIKQGGVMDIKEKEDFKAAFRNTDAFTLNFGGNEFAFKLNASGEFYYSEVRSAWQIWQAAKAQAVPEWISTADQLPVVKKCSEKLFNVVMLDYKSEPFVTSLTYMHEYEFYDSEDNFESERNEDGYVYHTGWVNHLNDDFFESIEADKVLYWMELPRVIEAQEQKG